MNTSYNVGTNRWKEAGMARCYSFLITLLVVLVFTGTAYAQQEITVQEITVTGQITDENNEPLPGATIAIEGTELGTTTDMDGRYMIDVAEDAVLVFSFVGYESQRIPVEGRQGIDVQMNIAVSTLAKLVVVGYGTQSRQDFTGSVAFVSEAEFSRRKAFKFLKPVLELRVNQDLQQNPRW